MKGDPMLPTRVLLYGVDEPLPERIPLRAGPLTLTWEAGDLRYIRYGETEVLRRIYVAIRDRNWDTAPNGMSNLVIEAGEDTFRITYDVENRLGDLHFTWRGEITGGADGAIRFGMDGVARTTFLKNRIGFCVLHPEGIAGAPARVHHVDGSTEEAALPRALRLRSARAALRRDGRHGARGRTRRLGGTALHRRSLRDGGSAQLDRRVVQDVLHPAAPALSGGDRGGDAHRADCDPGAARCARRCSRRGRRAPRAATFTDRRGRRAGAVAGDRAGRRQPRRAVVADGRSCASER